MPAAMVRILRRFSEERALRSEMSGILLERAQDYYPAADDADYSYKDDAPWIRRFADAAGRAIISGDTNMMSRPHEKLALLEADLVVIFFSSSWSKWKFCRKCALFMHWWPAIARAIKTENPGFYRVSQNHPDDDNLLLQKLSTADLKLEKIQTQIADGPRKRSERQRKSIEQSKGLFDK